jgi:class 3 adenylate cyclase
MLFIAAALCLGMGAIVALSGDEPRVKWWFGLLCLSCAAVCGGLWVELHVPRDSFLAARINMTAALLATSSALVAVCRMCRIPLHRPLLVLLGSAALVNVATVWVTDIYFRGTRYEYAWGSYVAGDPRFVINPILSSLNGICTLVLLIRNWRKSHPLDRNRAKYLLVAIAFLAMSLLDYLPHFGVDLFGGSVSALSMPLFAFVFGYACLRYRLMVFREAVGRAAGLILTAILLVGAYALFLEIDRRWLALGVTASHAGAAIVGLSLFATLGTRLPRWVERALGAVEFDFRTVIERFSDELLAIVDERALNERLAHICTTVFGSAQAVVLGPDELAGDPTVSALARAHPVVESEPYRRKGAGGSALLDAYEIVVPLSARQESLGAFALGRRSDATMYSANAVQSFRVLGNIFAIALSNARRAVEIQSRHRLDRYLPPQVVESVLAGRHDSIERKQRMSVTVFFSDLKGFTEIADQLPPDALATVLNEYLSEMADIAFRHGGTLDKFIGDAVMVFFGAPVACDAADHARRCVEMAIDMQRHLRTLNTGWKARGLIRADLVARMGIHTGEATVGSFGSHNRLEYTAIGNAVNLASRLEGKDTPGCILVSHDTWSLVDGRFRAKARGPIEVKGFSAPVDVFEIDPGSPTYRSERFEGPLPVV